MKAFKCDICGDCIESEMDTKTKWIVATINGDISNVDTQVGIGLAIDACDHICNACRIKARNIALQWIVSNFGA